MIYLAFYLVIGLLAGLLSGLLGLGGGIIIIPGLVACFALQYPHLEPVMQIATATSLASISMTSLMVIWSQQKRGAIDWKLLRVLVPCMMIGSLAGVVIGKFLSTEILQIIFATFCVVLGLKFLLQLHQTPTETKKFNVNYLIIFSLLIGIFSGLLGLGGGVLLVPLLLWMGLSMPQVSGTSIACVFPTAIVGMIAATIIGWNSPDLPSHSLGYVYWPAALLIGLSSILAAPLGVKMLYYFSPAMVKKIFGGILLIIAWRMLPI